jgi:hypothetical protein
VFRFRFNYLHCIHVDECALPSILPSPSLMDMTYFSGDTKATPASVQGVGVEFSFDMVLASPRRFKRVSKRTARFRCVFGSTDSYGVRRNWVF